MKMHLDNAVLQFDTALRTLSNVGQPVRATPAQGLNTILNPTQARLSGAYMRVNHVGEVCAQALYAGQALTARTPEVRQFNLHSAMEERDHLLWCARRLQELRSHTSYLNPLWYAGAFALGAWAGLAGDKVSLAFVHETEAQVEAHLGKHIDLLPPEDKASLAIVKQMQVDEMKHKDAAQALGAATMPGVAKSLMGLSAKLMTVTAHHI